MLPELPPLANLPDTRERAPRHDRLSENQCNWLRLSSLLLQGALVALIGRNTSTLALSNAQRLSHFPASPLVTISWFRGVESGLMTDTDSGPSWRPFGSSVVISGTQSAPSTCWTPTSGTGYIACFNADAAQALFDIELSTIQDRFLPIEEVLGDRHAPLWQALLASKDDELLGVLDLHLAPRWQALQGHASGKPSIRQLGRHWVERLAWRAQTWSRIHSPRHVERRIKSFSGRSLREWQSLVKTEGLFFAARDRYEAGQELDWAALAQEEGFADQAHMSRVTKRITGFSPTEFAQRFIEDESFWVYRLWM